MKMYSITFTADLFLRSMSSIYLFAFASLYVQIPGLYGKKGILPAHLFMEDKPSSGANAPRLLPLEKCRCDLERLTGLVYVLYVAHAFNWHRGFFGARVAERHFPPRQIPYIIRTSFTQTVNTLLSLQ